MMNQQQKDLVAIWPVLGQWEEGQVDRPKAVAVAFTTTQQTKQNQINS